MKKLLFLFLFLLLISLITCLCGCGHVHQYSKWSLVNHEHGALVWDQSRTCTNCGYTEVHIETAIKGK